MSGPSGERAHGQGLDLQSGAPDAEDGLTWHDISATLEQADKLSRSTRQKLRHAMVPLTSFARLRDCGLAAWPVYATLALHANERGIAYPGIATIVVESGVSRKQVFRSVAKLRKAGLVDVTRGGETADGRHLRVNFYTLPDIGKLHARLRQLRKWRERKVSP